jgi:uncharacterized protein
MELEFDSAKSRRNKEKYGIDFVETQLIWEDVDRIEIPARTEDELRYFVIRKIERKYWSAIITYRKEKVRIISVRRSRNEEIAIYES